MKLQKLTQKLLTGLILIWIVSLPSYADDDTLNELFVQLKNVAQEKEARRLEHMIWKQWFKSGDAAIDELMETAMEKRRWYDFNGALEILNQIIELKPDYSEAWNQRATVYFRQQSFEKSLIDIAKTLELEPRHFGAMAGRAVIRLQQNKPALARQNIMEAIKFHPYLKERNMFPGL